VSGELFALPWAGAEAHARMLANSGEARSRSVAARPAEVAQAVSVASLRAGSMSPAGGPEYPRAAGSALLARGNVATQAPSTFERFWRLVFRAALSAEDEARIEDERIESNRARTAGLLPILAVIHVAMLWVFRPLPDAKHAVFRQGVFWTHLLTLPVTTSLLAVAVLAPKRGWRAAWVGDAVLCMAIYFGLFLSLNTHNLSPNLNGLTIALFSGTLVMRPTVYGSIVAYGGAAVGLLVGIEVVQPDPELQTASLTTGLAAILLTFAFSRALNNSFARDVAQRLTIARQKSELLAWNAELEGRVQAQVTEALAQKAEVRVLDAQLRSKVRDRSRELARALRKATGEIELSPGTKFEQRFQIDSLIGEGAMGDVYEGRDLATGQVVAIKLLRRWDGITSADLKRFVMEAGAAAAVVHPAIVRTFHVDVTEGGQLYHVMERISGRTLEQELAKGRYDAGQTARLGAVVADALAAAHAAGVVHRDIKPGNLMLCAGAPGVKVLDFGISKLHDEEHTGVTHAGQVVGTPLYMAPEQIMHGGTVTGACDVYALGQVLYEMLTGEPSFAGRTVGEVLRAHVSEGPASVRAKGHSAPPELSELLRRCLSKAPEERPSADTLAACLRVIADSLGAAPVESIGAPRFPKGPVVIDRLPEVLDTGDVEATVQAEVIVVRPRAG